MRSEPSLNIEHRGVWKLLKSLKLIKETESISHAIVFYVFRQICEVVVVGVEFWIFPFIGVCLVVPFLASLLPKITLSIVCCLFLWVRKHTISLWNFGEFFLRSFLVIAIFILSKWGKYRVMFESKSLVGLFDFFLSALLCQSKSSIVQFGHNCFNIMPTYAILFSPNDTNIGEQKYWYHHWQVSWLVEVSL